MLLGIYAPTKGRIVRSWYCPIISQNPADPERFTNDVIDRKPNAAESTTIVGIETGTLLEVDEAAEDDVGVVDAGVEGVGTISYISLQKN